MNDARLRELYQLALRQRSGDRAGCLPLETIAALAARRLNEPEALRAMDHVTGCAACRREYSLLDAVHGEAQPERRPSRRLLLAASVAVIIGAGVIWRAAEVRSPPDVFRGEENRMVLVSPSEVIAAAIRPTFVWRSGALDARYRFELLRPDGDPIFSAVVADTTVTLPDSIRLQSGVEYRWWVRASLADGRQLSSGMQRLLVAPR